MRILVLALALAVSAGAAFAQSAGPVGLWLTENGKSQVAIERCADKLCGNIVWLKEPNDDAGQPKRDKKNTDTAKQSRAILGLELLSGFVRAADAAARWQDGSIYNPEDGDTYKCTLTLQDADTLRVRGYVGIPLLGKTQIWTRVKS